MYGTNFIFEITACVLLRLLGFGNAVVYGYSRQVKNIILNKASKAEIHEESLTTIYRN